jgi:CheY-like chemotaxis protein
MHMLKGDAKLLGLDAVYAAAHDMELQFDAWRATGFDAASDALVSLRRHVADSRGLTVADHAPATGDVSSRHDRPRGLRGDGAPWRILLIDDSEIALEVQCRVLRADGFDVRGARGADEVPDLLQDWSPQVILADVDMPAVTGPELCRQLKAHYDTAHVPIVLCSAMSVDALATLARECEADGWVSKASLETLAEELGELCETMSW